MNIRNLIKDIFPSDLSNPYISFYYSKICTIVRACVVTHSGRSV
jgi:hypothetical protein